MTVTANAAPTVGTYADQLILHLANRRRNRYAQRRPADNGSIATMTAAGSIGFLGTFTTNAATGAVTVLNAAPAGMHTITVTVTDNCGATAQRTFMLAVNTPPTISAVATARQQGSAAANSTIANVNDADGGALSVTVTSANPSNGVTVSGVANNSGVITADIVAACGATDASFTLSVTDNKGAMATATLNVTVTANTPPVLSYGNQSVTYGNALTINPATGPSDNVGVVSSAVQNIAPALGAGTITVNSSGVVSVSNNVPAGSYAVTMRATDACGGANGTTDAAFTLTVNQALPLITWANPADITYGTPLSATQLNAAANLAGSFNYTPGLTTVLNAGNNQTLNVSFTPSDTANYQNATASATLNVLKAVLTVKADDKSKVYGAALPTCTATITGFVNNDAASVISGTPALSTTATAASGVGNYPITVDVSGLSAANYSFTAQSGTLGITPAPLTVSANNKSKVYGADLPVCTASYTGFVNNDTAATALTGAPELTTAVTTATGVGNYDINAALGTLGAANYSLTFVKGTLTVTPAPLTVKADDKTKLYGAVNPTFTATITGYVNNETAAVLTGTLAFATTATQFSNVGGYPLTPSGVTAANYAIAFVNGTLTVTTQALTVKADDKSKVYGAANPAFSVTYTGFLGSDGPSSLGGTLTCTTSATASSAVGGYAVTPGGLTSANYAITFVAGTLTVTSAPLTVTTDNKARAHGAANPPLTGTVAGVVNNDNITVTRSTTAIVTSPLGAYPITPAISDPGSKLGNYNLTSSGGTLTVTCPPITPAPTTLPNAQQRTA